LQNRIWIDVEALFTYARSGDRLSGIQRVEFELYRALRTHPQGKDRIFFVRHDQKRQSLAAVPWESVESLYNFLSNGSSQKLRSSSAASRIRSAVTALIRALPPEPRDIASLQIEVLIRLIQLVRGRTARIARVLKRYLRFRNEGAVSSSQRDDDFAVAVGPGDVLAAFGGAYITPSFASCVQGAAQEKRLKLALLIYDIIPLRRSEWYKERVVYAFRSWLDGALPIADTVLTISGATARDVTDYARRANLALRAVPTPIPIGTGFKQSEPGQRPERGMRSSRLPPPDSYALFVSTIEVRKNHALLFQVWRHLLEEMPAATVPSLVFAGRVGWLVSDLMEQLHNCGFLGGKIIHVESPTDAELEALYEGCLFTLFPSFYEGWGLPVTESYAFGCPCIVSRTTSLPEAGGSLARYIDPDNATEACKVIRETIEDRAGLSQWRERVRREFRPVAWSESAGAVLQALDGDAGAAKLRRSA
jgi:glycosyltransferase involved in cell wall biosynthesis